MKLFFRNSNGQDRLIAEPSNIEEILTEIRKFLEEHNYKSPYMRVIQGDNSITFDVGSWSEFFICEGASYYDYIKYKNNKQEDEKHDKRRENEQET
jgi:hypothetical protein